MKCLNIIDWKTDKNDNDTTLQSTINESTCSLFNLKGNSVSFQPSNN